MSEHAEQVAVFEWARLLEERRPELALLFAIPNGGARHPATGRKLKAEGVKRGVPDLCLPVARGAYHGFYAELKTGTGRVTPEQRWWAERLQAHGYAYYLCRGARGAIAAIEQYLGGEF